MSLALLSALGMIIRCLNYEDAYSVPLAQEYYAELHHHDLICTQPCFPYGYDPVIIQNLLKGCSMPITLALSLACASLSCGPAQASDAPKLPEAPQTPEIAQAPEAPESGAPMAAQPAKLIAFDGAHDFMKTSRRLRIWREIVQFDMTVDPQGTASGCEVVDRFRKTYVNQKLCDVVMAHYSFEPARNAQNEAVEGSYRARISYAQLREELD